MNLADKTIINILAKSGEAVFLLVSSIVMVRCLDKTEYGTFLQIMLIMNTAIMFTFLGLPQSIYYYLHKTSNKVSFVCKNIVTSIAISCLAGLVVFFFSDYLVRWLNNPLLAEYKYVMAVLVVVRGPLVMREPLLISQGNLVLNAVSGIVSNCLFYLPVIAGAFFSVGLNILLKVLLIFSIFDFICFFGIMSWFLTKIKNHPIDESKGIRSVTLLEQFRYAFPIGLSSYIGIVGRQIDQYIVSVFFSPQNFAVYSRGAMRIPVLSSIQYTINSIMMPNYVKDIMSGKIQNFLKKYHTCIETVAKINFPVFVFLYIHAPFLIVQLYTEEYVEATPVFRVYLLLLLLNVTVFGIIPNITGETRYVFIATVLNLGTNIVLSCFLVPFWGVLGAAYATIICSFVSGTYYIWQSCNLLKIDIADIWPWKNLSKLMLISILAGIFIYTLLIFLVNHEIGFWTLLPISFVTYLYVIGFLYFKLNMLTSYDFDILKRWLRIDVEKWLRIVSFSW